MASTYSFISSTTLGGTASNVTFSSISGSYTDLVLVCALKGTAALQYKIQFNNDTDTKYSNTILAANGTSSVASRASNAAYIAPDYYNATSTDGGNSFINIMNYSNTTTYKPVLIRTNNASAGLNLTSGLWRSTSAINRIDLTTVSSTFAAGSVFSLFGIKAA